MLMTHFVCLKMKNMLVSFLTTLTTIVATSSLQLRKKLITPYPFSISSSLKTVVIFPLVCIRDLLSLVYILIFLCFDYILTFLCFDYILTFLCFDYILTFLCFVLINTRLLSLVYLCSELLIFAHFISIFIMNILKIKYIIANNCYPSTLIYNVIKKFLNEQFYRSNTPPISENF